MAKLYPLSDSGVISPGKSPTFDSGQSTSSSQATLRYLLTQKKQREADFARVITKDVLTDLRGETQKVQADAFADYQKKWTDIYKATNGRLNLKQKMELQGDLNKLMRDQKIYLSSQKNYEDQMRKLQQDLGEGKYDVKRSTDIQFDLNDPYKNYLVAAATPMGELVSSHLNEFKATSSTSNTTRDEEAGVSTTSSTKVKSALDTPEKLETEMRRFFRDDSRVRYSVGRDFEEEPDEVKAQYMNMGPFEYGQEDQPEFDLESYAVDKYKDLWDTKVTTSASRDLAESEKSEIFVQPTFREGSTDPTYELGNASLALAGQFPTYDESGNPVKTNGEDPIISAGKITQVRKMNINGTPTWVAQVVYSENKETPVDITQRVMSPSDPDYNETLSMAEIILSSIPKGKDKKIAYIPYEPLKGGFRKYRFDGGPSTPLSVKTTKKSSKSIAATDDFDDFY